MASFNFSTKQMAAKIVYYGPGLGGKTTSLKHIFDHTASESRGKMVSLATETDRTLFFDLLPLEVGTVAGFKTRIQLYTVPGQVFYNSTRRLVLKGVDGVVFVADSQAAMLPANLESFRNLEVNLAELGISIDEIPLVLQYNKRDLQDICSAEELQEALNRNGWPEFETSALDGTGVFETLREISRLTLLSLKKQLETAGGSKPRPAAGATVPAPAPAPDPAPVVAAATSSETGADYVGEGPPPWRGGAPETADSEPPSSEAGEAPADDLVLAPDEEPERAATVDAAVPDGTAPDPSEPEDGELDAEAAAGEPVEAEAPTDELEAIAEEPDEDEPGAVDDEAEEPSVEDEIAAVGDPRNGHRELDRSLAVELERGELSRARTVAFDLQIRDGSQRVLHQMRDVEIDLEDLEDLESVRLRLQIALQSRTEAD